MSLGQALSLRGLADRSGRCRAFRQNNLRTGKLAHAGSPGVRMGREGFVAPDSFGAWQLLTTMQLLNKHEHY